MKSPGRNHNSAQSGGIIERIIEDGPGGAGNTVTLGLTTTGSG